MLKNLRLGHKLLLAFGLLIAVVALSNAATFAVLTLAMRSSDLNTQGSDMLNDLDDMFEAALQSERAATQYAIEPGDDHVQQFDDGLKQFADKSKALRDRAQGYRQQAELLGAVDGLDQAFANWRDSIGAPVFAMGKNHVGADKMTGLVKSDSADQLEDRWVKSALATKEQLDAWSAADQIAQDNAIATARNAQALGFAIAIGAALVAGVALSRAIGRPIQRLTEIMSHLAAGHNDIEVIDARRRDEIGRMAAAIGVFKTNAIERLRFETAAETQRTASDAERRRAMDERAALADEQGAAISSLGAALKRLAAGDLTVRLDQRFVAAYEPLRGDFNHAAEQLMHTVQTVTDGTSQIQSGAKDISSAADKLSVRTEQQAASLEETATTLDQITATVKRSAASVRHAAQAAAKANDRAQSGASVVRQAVEAMGAISKSSTQIGQIISVIDEIAFQTNLLALNAGVEAARAGEAGRGFAVVASEVRALAQRSADAAKDIKTIISSSGGQVDSGVRLVTETGSALDGILNQVSEINQVIADIAASAEEQANGLQQVNAAINQMDQSTQENATMVEQSTAASHALVRETDELAGVAQRFRVETAGQKPSPARRAA